MNNIIRCIELNEQPYLQLFSFFFLKGNVAYLQNKCHTIDTCMDDNGISGCTVEMNNAQFCRREKALLQTAACSCPFAFPQAAFLLVLG